MSSRSASRAATDPRVVLAIVSVGVLLSSLDLFIVNLAVPAMSEDLDAGLSGLSWVLNLYAIVFAALLVPAGRLGDRGGNRVVFLLGLTVFAAGSALCAAAWNVESLIVFRVVQAVGCALMTPSSLALVLAATPPERRAGAVRLWVAFGGLGAALGPVVGGVLVAFDWRWVFLVNVPIGLATLAIGLRRLPSPPAAGGPLPDLVGAGALIGAVGSLVLAVVQGPEWGWSSPGVLAAFAVALACGVLFAVSSARHHSPLVDASVLRLPNVVLAAVNSVVFQIAFAGMLLSATLWAQDVWGWSALRAGLAIAPGPLVVPFVAILAGRLIGRVGPGPVIAAGGFAFGGGLLWWALAIALSPDYVSGMLGGMLLTGVGVGLIVPTAFAAGSSALPPASFATGSGVLSMARQLGLAGGVAVLVAVLGTPDSPVATLEAFRRAWWVMAAVAVFAGLLGLGLRRTSPGGATREPSDAPEQHRAQEHLIPQESSGERTHHHRPAVSPEDTTVRP
ncbi:MFS transporter [Nocardia puris]|uniref:EmrB/QacA subfamily drug resistance transporter n=1 Tax=Nocardia puris TaxID=208602 RepID=A0A366DVP9_9NOCA|nr:MFS transporter [Nocardia puris]MBF6210104.1 MFS transporter [Nocardia puris]MBF6368295.1 MFS transporter [Nocardia puris]MBF6457987.1 MFS transporter [Nocardia puris]RBO94147.1 EmrB/QacA subfamily drug resistance transporter [Nocardia puris]